MDLLKPIAILHHPPQVLESQDLRQVIHCHCLKDHWVERKEQSEFLIFTNL